MWSVVVQLVADDCSEQSELDHLQSELDHFLKPLALQTLNAKQAKFVPPEDGAPVPYENSAALHEAPTSSKVINHQVVSCGAVSS